MPGGNPQNHRGNPAGKVYALKAKRNMLASSKSKATVNGRLYVRGAVLSYKGGLRTQYAHTSILRLENVADAQSARFYAGKRVAYIYTAKNKNIEGSRYRCIWGKTTRPHGTNGCVRAKFRSNLPPQAIGGRVRVMLYPSNI